MITVNGHMVRVLRSYSGKSEVVREITEIYLLVKKESVKPQL